jgi:Omp85 superfamily domain
VNTVEALSIFRRWILLLLFMVWGSCFSLAQTSRTQDTLPSDRLSVAEAQDAQGATQPPSSNPHSNPSADNPAGRQGRKKQDKKHKWHLGGPNGSIVAAPLPIVSPALGAGIIPVLGYITPIPAKDKVIEPSVVGAGGLITNNGTRGFGLATDLYLDKARYEVETAYAHGNIDYNLYGVGFVNGNAGFKLPLQQTGYFFFLKMLRKIGWDTYVGIRFIDGSSFITLKPTSEKIPPIPTDVGLHTNLRAVGTEVWRDSRPSRFYPLKGSVLDFTGDFFGQDLGSKYSFQSYKFTFNKYWSLTDKQVLAYNLFWCGTAARPRFTAIAFTAPTMNFGAIQLGDI